MDSKVFQVKKKLFLALLEATGENRISFTICHNDSRWNGKLLDLSFLKIQASNINFVNPPKKFNHSAH